MRHKDQVIRLLRTQIDSEAEVTEIGATAEEVAGQWVNPLSGGVEQTNGLIYGLIQSGKTGVLAVTAAIGADEGYKALIILTTDIDPLYEQTLGRAREAFPGIDIIGKTEFKDAETFLQRIKAGTCVIVSTKNASLLSCLIENFQRGRVRGLTCLIIDDEADQASLNTKATKQNGERSRINERITTLRGFFQKNTYIQVTATPQALFLQTPDHEFRPKFTVLSHPGSDYVGGEDFFGEGSQLVREFELNDITTIAPGAQPNPSLELPNSLVRALDIFMIGATYKRLADPSQNCAFLCHVSTLTRDHKHIENLLRKYKTDLATDLKGRGQAAVKRLRAAYADLSKTHEGLSNVDFDKLVETIEFFSPGITVKLVNGQTDEDVAVRSPYNLFVGGNKLGRGVTIKNLLVSYYGRNPRNPQADTVLQHARMYGYRRHDIGLLRLFLPRELRAVFSAINLMEKSLRDMIADGADEEFRGIYIDGGGLSPTRRNVLVPGSIGVYTAGSIYNPAQILRDDSAKYSTERIDKRLVDVKNKSYVEVSIEDIKTLIKLTASDPAASEHVWNPTAVAESVVQLAKLRKHTTGYVYVDRGRQLAGPRRETAGILTGGETGAVPSEKITLFLLRMTAGSGKQDAWWPQIRFPGGRYAFAFAI